MNNLLLRIWYHFSDKTHFNFKVLTISIFVILQINTCWASVQSGKTCDTLGSLVADPSHRARPVKYEDIDATALISACLSAIHASGRSKDLGRYYLQLGRGQLRSGKVSPALSSFKSSARLQYPAAYFALGVTYLLGHDIERDDEKARNYLLKALKKNVFWAAKALAKLHSDETSDFYDGPLAEKYISLFLEQRA